MIAAKQWVIAQICHEANKVYCESLGDFSHLHWDQAPDWQKESALAGVAAVIDDPGVTPRELHQKWLELKQKEGWKWGNKKDSSKKEHPCFVEYDELPSEQRAKDVLFGNIVRAFIEGWHIPGARNIESSLGKAHL